MYPGGMKTKLFEKAGINKDLSNALDITEVAKIIKFMLSLNENTVIPDITIMSNKG